MANELMLRPEAPVRHVYEWQTDVIRSYNGTEQRIAARLRPRQRLEFTVLLHNDDEIRRWHRFLASSTVGQVTIPAWHDAISVSSSVAAGVTTIPGDFATSDIAAGDTVVLVPPGDGNGTEDSGWEYGTVDSISDTQVVLTGVTTLALPVGSVVAPAITGKFTGSAGYRQHPQGAAVLPVTLTVDQQSTIGGNGGTAISTYQGLNVLDRRPLNNSLLETSFHQDVELIDFGHKFSLNTDETPSRTRTRRVYQIETREELQFWRLFLSACVGRREPFYAPTYRPDLAVVSNTASAVVVSDDFETWYADMNCRDHLQVETDDGSVSQHYISGVADNMDGTWTLNVDGTISGNVLTCSFLEVVRLGSDVVLFEHFGHRSQVSVTLETVDELQTYTSSTPTHSALFSPAADYASIANASEVANVDGLDEFTIEFWWRPINVGGSLGLVTDFSAPNNMICQLSGGDPRFAVRLAGGYEIISGTPSIAVATLTWYHFAYIWDGVNGEQRIYIHGGGMSDEKVAENLSAGTGAATVGAGDWTISSIDSGASQNSNGHFSQVRLWGKVRSLAEIQADRETLLEGTETDLLAHWSLNNTWDDDVAGGVALTNSGGAFDTEVPF